jgi:hypothetical protein
MPKEKKEKTLLDKVIKKEAGRESPIKKAVKKEAEERGFTKKN